ncbi:hypothetical protein V5O48_008321 [Marasmius crinis-equi]|uniref:DAGKc domain-containing protein n=1 Tax=Marasmius crinis-equi TaxID=585013 RepID=A0ABR3FEQ0_9AGAR
MSIAIYNPVSGNGTAKDFFDQEVIPLLQRANKPTPKLVATDRSGHAGEIVHEALETLEGEITVFLGAGDGTLHEIINFLSLSGVKGPKGRTDKKLHLVLVPCGTANALYSSLFPPSTPESLNEVAYKLQSVQSFIDGKRIIPLTLAISTLSSPPVKKQMPKGEEIIHLSSSNALTIYWFTDSRRFFRGSINMFARGHSQGL